MKKILEDLFNEKNGVSVVDMGEWVAVELPTNYDPETIRKLLILVWLKTQKPIVACLGGQFFCMDVYQTNSFFSVPIG